jgi:hypothetical protein
LKEAEELEIKWKEAECLVMKTIKMVLGADHLDTLESMSKLALVYRNQQKWKKAEDIEVISMEDSLNVLGAEHPNTLTSMSNLASTYRHQEKWTEAEEVQAVLAKDQFEGFWSETSQHLNKNG